MAYCNVDDIVLHYEVVGQGMPLILLHGNGEDMQYFNRQIPVFSLAYKVICVDTRGHGMSTRGTKPMTFSTFCEDLRLFMETMGIFKAHLLGFSDGANIALTFALAYPKKVAALILNSPNLSPDGLLPILRLQLQLKYQVLRLLPFSKKAVQAKELLELMVKQPTIAFSKLLKLPLNTLLIVGENDMIKDIHTKMIAKTLPHCVYRKIPDGDHFIALKKPEIFNQEIMKFLAGFQSGK